MCIQGLNHPIVKLNHMKKKEYKEKYFRANMHEKKMILVKVIRSIKTLYHSTNHIQKKKIVAKKIFIGIRFFFMFLSECT
jgi:hypothetical protein